MANFQPKPIWEDLAKKYEMMLKSHLSGKTGLLLFSKRVMDLIVIIPALILLLPVMVFVGLAVWGNLGTSLIFRDKRIGKRGCCEPQIEPRRR